MTHRHHRPPRPAPLAVHTSARAIAAAAVARVLDDGALSQAALSQALSGTALDARDRAFCTELFYGTLRWAPALEKSLLRAASKPGKGLDERIRPHLLVAAYQLQQLSTTVPAHAAVKEAVSAVRAVRPGLDGFANALLRNLGSPLVDMVKGDDVDALADALGLPSLLAHAVADRLPAEARRAALSALNARPLLYALSLDDAGPPAAAVRHAFVPGAFVIEGSVVDNADFQRGGMLVMDPGSALCALAVDAQPGWRVLELCAAPGSKTVVLARAVGAAGRVVAVDKSERRTERIKDNLARTGLAGRVELRVADALALDDAQGFDAVLLDAPCSGFGTTRRKPEIKLRRTADDVANNAKLQRALLDKAASLLRPGGVLVYSVCSPVDAEGADVVRALLAAPNDLRNDLCIDAAGLPRWLPADAVDAEGFVRLLPHSHDADGFFIARLRRSPAT